MKIISTNCPNCGASLSIDKDKSSFSCNYCGNTFLLDNEVRHIKYDNVEEAGYQFEKGRQRAQIERSQNQAQLTFKQPSTSKNTRKTWLWVLGWIFLFPLPLTIILIKNNSINKVLKYIIIVAAWLAYLAIGLYGMYNNTNTATKNEKQNSSAITQSNSVIQSNDSSGLLVEESKYEESNLVIHCDTNNVLANEYFESFFYGDGRDPIIKVGWVIPKGKYRIDVVNTKSWVQVSIYVAKSGTKEPTLSEKNKTPLLLKKGETAVIEVDGNEYIHLTEPDYITLTLIDE